MNEIYRFGVIHRVRVAIIERRELCAGEDERVKEKREHTHTHMEGKETT